MPRTPVDLSAQKEIIFFTDVIVGDIFTARKRSLRQGNIFIGVCQEFCSQGGKVYLVQGGVPGQVPPGRYTPYQVPPTHPRPGTPPGPGTPPRTRCTWSGGVPPTGPGTPPTGPGTPPQTRYTPPDQVHSPTGPGTPPCSACWEIRATSGWYASYWNAFLFIKKIPLISSPLIWPTKQQISLSRSWSILTNYRLTQLWKIW